MLLLLARRLDSVLDVRKAFERSGRMGSGWALSGRARMPVMKMVQSLHTF